MFSEELEKAKYEAEILELRKAMLNLQGKLIKAKSKHEELARVVGEAAYEAVIGLGGIGNVTPPKLDKRKAREVVCLWHLTDWQGGKRTTTYNSDVMVERVNEFVVKAHKLVEDYRKARPVKECVILFTGDMVEGLWNFQTQPYEVDSSAFTMYVNVSKLIVETVQKALGIFEKVTVVCEYGNHGRIGRKGEVPKENNIDLMCYELARQLLKDEKRLTWQQSPEDWQPVVIGNYRAIALHGDEIGRHGFASPAAIVAHIQRWQSGSLGFDFKDAYLGHYHTFQQWHLANTGSVYQTGSTESDNRYAQISLASTAQPSQRMHIIDPVKGLVISEHKIILGGK